MHLSGTVEYYYEETDTTYYIDYEGFCRKAKITSDPETSYPAESEITLLNLPSELEEYEGYIKQKAWEESLGYPF